MRISKYLFFIFLCVISILVRVRLHLPGGLPFEGDSAYHFRIAMETAATGCIPEADPLFVQDPPRDPSRIYTPNLYYLSSGVIRLGRLLGPSIPPEYLIYGLNSVLGALWFIPLFLICYSLTRNFIYSLIIAALPALFPDQVERTSSMVLRFESVALLIVLCQIWMVICLTRRLSLKTNRIILWTMLCLHILGFGFWRLYSPLMCLFCLCMMIRDFFSTNSIPSSGVFSKMFACAGLISLLLYRHYLLGNWIAWSMALVPCLLAIIHFLVFETHAGRRILSLGLWKKILACVVVATIGCVFLYLCFPFFKVKVQELMGWHITGGFQSQLYAFGVQEHTDLNFLGLLTSPAGLALSLLLGATLALIAFFPKQIGKFFPSEGDQLLVVFTLALFPVAMFFNRMASIFIPLLFLSTGICLIRFNSGETWPGWARRFSLIVIMVSIFFLPCFTALNYKKKISLPSPKPDLYLKLSQLDPRATTVVAIWDEGFEIESYAHKRVIMDGFLENPINLQRIEEFDKALFSSDEEVLHSFIARWGGSHLLIDRRIYPRFRSAWEAWQAAGQEDPAVRSQGRSIIIPNEDSHFNIVRCAFFPLSCRQYQTVFESGPYIVLELKDRALK